MGASEHLAFPSLEDGPRLLAIGRIPRCDGCLRYQALVVAHALPGRPRLPLPAAPRSCRHRLCAPLVERYEEALSRRGSITVLSGTRVARG